MILQPENANKRIDNLGRITLPKGLRSRLYLETGTEMELYTMVVAGKHYICLTKADKTPSILYPATFFHSPESIMTRISSSSNFLRTTVDEFTFEMIFPLGAAIARPVKTRCFLPESNFK